jgi:hypothetical protein
MGEEEERLSVIGGKAKEKETARKTKTKVCGSWRGGMG